MKTLSLLALSLAACATTPTGSITAFTTVGGDFSMPGSPWEAVNGTIAGTTVTVTSQIMTSDTASGTLTAEGIAKLDEAAATLAIDTPSEATCAGFEGALQTFTLDFGNQGKHTFTFAGCNPAGPYATISPLVTELQSEVVGGSSLNTLIVFNPKP